jgi:hypothetical protein
MFNQLIKLLVLPPELLRGHARAYADLAHQSWQEHVLTLKYRWLMYALAAVCLLLALVLGGVALLLWSALPVLREGWVGVMWALPLALVVCSVVCAVWAQRLRSRPLLADLKEQLQLDLQAIRQVQTS